jgi:cell division protein DivIC
VKKAFKRLTNKYLLTSIAFLAIMLFFDQNDWITQRKRSQDLKKVNGNIEHLKNEVSRMEKEIEALNNNPTYLEKYAREKYFKKRDGEDVYIFVTEDQPIQ